MNLEKNTFGKGAIFENFVAILNGKDNTYTDNEKRKLCSKIQYYRDMLKELRKIEKSKAINVARILLQRYKINDAVDKLQTHYNCLIQADYRKFLNEIKTK